MTFTFLCRLAWCLLRFEVEFFAVDFCHFLPRLTQSNVGASKQKKLHGPALSRAPCYLLLIYTHTDVAPLIRDCPETLSQTKSRFSNAACLRESNSNLITVFAIIITRYLKKVIGLLNITVNTSHIPLKKARYKNWTKMIEKAADVQRKTLKTFRNPGELLLPLFSWKQNVKKRRVATARLLHRATYVSMDSSSGLQRYCGYTFHSLC